MAKSMIESALNIMEMTDQFSYPLLILHGKKDIVTKHENSLKFHDTCSR